MVVQGVARRVPVGAEITDAGVHFRVWAPSNRRVEVILEGSPHSFVLEREDNGYFSALVSAAHAGTLYRFRLDGDAELYPDPASRFQPQGPEGPSEVIDPESYCWNVDQWPDLTRHGQVFYEMHLGTFTPEGTWNAATEKLARLAGIGITALEVMPVSEFPGRFGWGYDGVNLWAPTRLYGRPDEFRAFIDSAHQHGLGVILDVVYNHLGPDGNYLTRFTPDYFTTRYKNEWGDAINFDGSNAASVREFFTENAAYWISEFRLDGLRLDATQTILDSSPGEHIIAAVTRRAREAAGGRRILIVAENEPQDTRLLRSRREGGFEVDALWNDDFHHAAIVALTAKREAYYTDYNGSPQEFISAAKYGFLYQGQHYKWQKQRRGTPSLKVPPSSFICYIQNHDQIANSADGQRIHTLTTPGRVRAMTALMLLSPASPLIFQGQEFATSSPFLYFADHKPELAQSVAKGRADFLSQFPSIKAIAPGNLPLPHDETTFTRSRLQWEEWDRNEATVSLYRDLLRLRKTDPTFSQQRSDHLDGAVLAAEAFLLRYITGGDGDRLLLFNFGRDLHLDIVPEPLLAPPENSRWEMLWSSEEPRYGGSGAPPVEEEGLWHLPGHAAVVLGPAARSQKNQNENPRQG